MCQRHVLAFCLLGGKKALFPWGKCICPPYWAAIWGFPSLSPELWQWAVLGSFHASTPPESEDRAPDLEGLCLKLSKWAVTSVFGLYWRNGQRCRIPSATLKQQYFLTGSFSVVTKDGTWGVTQWNTACQPPKRPVSRWEPGGRGDGMNTSQGRQIHSLLWEPLLKHCATGGCLAALGAAGEGKGSTE